MSITHLFIAVAVSALLLAHCPSSTALEVTGAAVDRSPKGFFGRKLHGWTCSCSICGTYRITPWDKNCKCCYETPKETSSCLAFICTPSYTLYFSNTCYNPLQLRWVDGAGQTRTAVFTSADGSALMDDNRRTVSINPKYGVGWHWAGEPVDWRPVKMTVKRHPCTGEDCDNCCNVQMGYEASFSC